MAYDVSGLPPELAEVLGGDYDDDPRFIDTDRDFGPEGMGRYFAVQTEAGCYALLDRGFCGRLTVEAGPFAGRDEAWRKAEEVLDRFCWGERGEGQEDER